MLTQTTRVQILLQPFMSCEALGKLLQLWAHLPGDIIVPFCTVVFGVNEVIPGKCCLEQILAPSMNYGGRSIHHLCKYFCSLRRNESQVVDFKRPLWLRQKKPQLIPMWMKEWTSFFKCFLSKAQWLPQNTRSMEKDLPHLYFLLTYWDEDWKSEVIWVKENADVKENSYSVYV